ncbi:hypothetical protein [Peristeroidobacter agariperforans]|uniref:hypothetical protein n=1 Tax=Peristeroidobacter agariperforans TaxID=268404 RepID=UPI00101D113C|nr:hypothetical protein [Peristeroidobacter agariperforans]
MFGFVDVVALLFQVLMQVDALIPSQCAIGLVLLFGLTNLPPSVAQLLRLVVGQLTCLDPVDDPTGLVHLPLIHSGIADRCGCSYGSILCVVLLFVDVAAGLVLLVVQINALGTGQLTIGFIRPLQLPNITLPLSQIPSLSPRELTRTNALPHALMLILLPSIDTTIPNARLSLTQAGDTDDAGNHQHQSEATLSDVEDVHTTTLVLFLRRTTQVGVGG